MEIIKVRSRTGYTKEVFHNNGVYLGDFDEVVDGYYNFWPRLKHNGYWSAHVLRALADKLDELNADWNKQLQEYMEKEKESEKKI